MQLLDNNFIPFFSLSTALSAMSAVTSTQTASPSPLLPRKMSAANSSSNVCRVALTTALKDLDLNSLAAVVTMASCTPCHHCNCLLFDEQIMTGWQADDSDFNTRCGEGLLCVLLMQHGLDAMIATYTCCCLGHGIICNIIIIMTSVVMVVCSVQKDISVLNTSKKCY